jgi:hypothetical protein
MKKIILLMRSELAKYGFKKILLKMYDAEKYRCKIREQLFLTARFNAGI